MNARPWPNSIVEILTDLLGAETFEHADHEALGGHRWLVDRFLVQCFGDEAAARARRQLLSRLGAVLPVATVRAWSGQWLVTARPVGQPIGRPELHPEPAGLPLLMGQSLRMLHDLYAESIAHELGLATGWPEAFARCRQLVDEGRVDIKTLPAPYDRYEPAKLLALVEAGRPEKEELVLCHGLLSTDDLLVDAGRISGFVGLDYLIVADRHLDLALAHRGVHETFGAEAVFALYDGYGLDADLIRLDHYMLMGVILQSGFAAGRSDTDQQARQ